MNYIKTIVIPNRERDEDFFSEPDMGKVTGKDAITDEIISYVDFNVRRTCYTSIYPFGIFRDKSLSPITLSDITLFCGSNGCGKSTLLNVIAEKLKLERMSAYNKTVFMQPFVDMTYVELSASAKDNFDPQAIGRRQWGELSPAMMFSTTCCFQEKKMNEWTSCERECLVKYPNIGNPITFREK